MTSTQMNKAATIWTQKAVSNSTILSTQSEII